MLPRRRHQLYALLVLATIAVGVTACLRRPGSAAVLIAAAVGIATVLAVLLDSAAADPRPAARPPRSAPDEITVDLGRRS